MQINNYLLNYIIHLGNFKHGIDIQTKVIQSVFRHIKMIINV